MSDPTSDREADLPTEYFATSLRDEDVLLVIGAIGDDSSLLPLIQRLTDHICCLQTRITEVSGCACDYDNPGDVCATHYPRAATL